MRVNIYNEEITDRVERIEKTVDGIVYFGVRFYLELPATVDGTQYRGPFMHRSGDDDSSAVTFWSTDENELRAIFQSALEKLTEDRPKGS
jgi:hypothetical protein